MLVLDIPRRSAPRFAYIDVPLYHRVHLALAAGVPVYACVLAGQDRDHRPEMVIAPFDFGKWDRLWRLSVSVYDRPGVLHDVCECIANNGANILVSESCMMEEQNVYHIEMIVEMQGEKQREKIEWSIKTALFNDHIFPDGNEEVSSRIAIRRLHNLRLAKQAYERQLEMPVDFAPILAELTPAIMAPTETAPGEQSGPSRSPEAPMDLPSLVEEQNTEITAPLQTAPGKQSTRTRPPAFRLRLPQSIRELLTSKIAIDLEGRLDEGRYMRLSDTKDRFMRVLFFKANDPVIHARLEHKDRPGALADLTRAIVDRGFNILAGFLAPTEGKKRSRLEVVIRAPSSAAGTDLKEALEDLLAEPAELSDLDLVVGYPNDYGSQWEHKQIPRVLRDLLPRASNSKWFAELKLKLDSYHDDLCPKIQSNELGGAVEQKWHFLHRLQEDCVRIWPTTTHPKSLFVSCHFPSDEMNLVKERARQMGFSVFTGEKLAGSHDIRGAVVKKIGACTHFLGVWSTHGAEQWGTTYWPSPWMHWEFGIAEAFGLQWQLLISALVSNAAWSRIAANVPHTIYDHDFESKLDEVLAALWEKPARRGWTPE